MLNNLHFDVNLLKVSRNLHCNVEKYTFKYKLTFQCKITSTCLSFKN